MTVKLNHTIVHARDKHVSAQFVSEILGLPEPFAFGPFLCVQTGNEVTLDFFETDDEIQIQHYAFLVGESEFDEIFARIEARDLIYWADPARTQTNRINRNDGGRGCYFEDPAGNLLEIITRPYGSGA
jgi:catechol 2,3-dioxygenase-like lactoylglutathione lyase family enzyme